MLLRCITQIYFFFFVCIAHQCLSTGGSERLIYDVNRAVKGKANRKEHAQHQRRTLSCSYIFLFSRSLSICPVTTVGAPLDVYRDTGLSPSITADILKGSFTSDRAASRSPTTDISAFIYLFLFSSVAAGKCSYQRNTCVQENKKKTFAGQFS